MRKIIDLFAGGGGFSLGAARAGFEIAASVEIDPYANETHSRNFPHTRHLGVDISNLSGAQLLSYAGVTKGGLAGLIGGPPCQGFSTIGKRDPEDSRNSLFGHFMRLVFQTKPAFFVAENVPGILNERNSEVVELALKKVPGCYRILQPTSIKASDHGVPTTRKRVFFVGYDPAKCDDLSIDIFIPPTDRPITTVGIALRGLPEKIEPNWQTEAQSWRPVSRINPALYFYSKAQGDVPKRVGDQFALDAFFESQHTSGCFGTLHSKEVEMRYASLGSREVDRISKSMRLDVDGFCPTLRAGTGSDKGSFQAVRPIHHKFARVITPREAARFQGFPDWYALHATKWHSFRQLGNSVSPIVAEDLLAKIFAKLK